MILQINQLTQSDIEAVRKIAWLIYERDNGENGLDKNDVEEILYLLSDIDNSLQKTIEEAERKAWDRGYDEGYRDGYSEGLYCNSDD